MATLSEEVQAVLDDLFTLAEMAREYGVERSTAYSWHYRSAVNGFPAPVFSRGRAKLWSRTAVREWIERTQP